MKNITHISFLCCFLTLNSSLHASELDFSFLNENGEATLEQYFSKKKYIKGLYVLDVYLNNVKVSKESLEVLENSDEYCFNDKWLSISNININRDYFYERLDQVNNCYLIEDDYYSSVEFDKVNNSINFIIPQVGLRKLNELSSSNFERGLSSIKGSYNLNFFSYPEGYDLFYSSSLKANIDRWVFSSSFYIDKNDYNIDFSSVGTYFKEINSNFNLGYVFSQNEGFSSSRIKGFNIKKNMELSSDDKYSPVVSGFARNASRVNITQGRSLIYSEILPTGPFVIDDLSILNSDDLHIEITDSKGYTTVSNVPVNYRPGFLRYGEFDYSFSFGVVDDENDFNDQVLTSLDIKYGLGSSELIYSYLYSPGYLGINLGYRKNMDALGVVNGNILMSDIDKNNANDNGVKFKLGHSISVKPYLNIQSSYEQNGYNFKMISDYNRSRGGVIKDRYSFSTTSKLSKSINLSTQYQKVKYWNSSFDRTNLNAYLFYNADKLSFNISSGLSNFRNLDDYNISLNVTIPLSVNGSKYNYSNSFSSTKYGGGIYQSNVSSNLSNEISYNIGYGYREDNKEKTYSSSFRVDNELFTGNLSFESKNSYVTSSGSINGSYLFIPEKRYFGLLKYEPNTIGIIKFSKDVENVTAFNRREKSNFKGEMILSLKPYSINEIEIDPSSISTEMEVLGGHFTLYPEFNSILYREVKVEEIKNYSIAIRYKSGKLAPFGTWVTDEFRIVGFIVNDGIINFSTYNKPKFLEFNDCYIPGDKIKDTDYLQDIICE
ncbi:TPA: fimbria/pilus outer membrane usher protein [Vibrio vulnificus]